MFMGNKTKSTWEMLSSKRLKELSKMMDLDKKIDEIKQITLNLKGKRAKKKDKDNSS
jgi:hypothetical protein